MSIANRLRLILAVLLLASFCAGSLHAADTASKNKGKIEGTKWTSQEATIKGNKIPAGILKLEFGKDGKLVYTAGPMKFTGTYVLDAGDTVTLKLDKELAGRKEHKEKITIAGKKLTMTDSDGTALTFDMVK